MLRIVHVFDIKPGVILNYMAWIALSAAVVWIMRG